MKTVLTACLILLTTSLSAQKTFDKDFNFSETTDEQRYQIPVPNGTDVLNLKLKSTLEAGTIHIRLIDPAGEDHGQFSLSCQAEEEVQVTVNNQSNGEQTQVQVNGQGTSTSTTTTSTSSSTSSSNSSTSIGTKGKEDNKKYSYSYSSISETDRRSKGNMKRRIAQPEAGTWEVVIEAKEATGDVSVKLVLE
ncbi:MAG: hypothetical protein AAF399_07800 [Bacteroidota bacterium]